MPQSWVTPELKEASFIVHTHLDNKRLSPEDVNGLKSF